VLCHSLILGSGATGFASAWECEYRPLRSTGGASGTLNSNCDKALGIQEGILIIGFVLLIQRLHTWLPYFLPSPCLRVSEVFSDRRFSENGKNDEKRMKNRQ
jgi:hypothetical protein